jgi:hypothetical protein
VDEIKKNFQVTLRQQLVTTPEFERRKNYSMDMLLRMSFERPQIFIEKQLEVASALK